MLSTLVGCFVLQALAAQVPLTYLDNLNQSPELGHISGPWNLDDPPHPNATGHFVFETVNSLLQHWPNTRYRNGKLHPAARHECLTLLLS